MIKRLAVFLILFNCTLSFAQTIKTDVLVIGGSSSGVAAAIQCAHSKVKVMLVEKGNRLCPLLTSKFMTNSLPDTNWPGGLWAELRRHIISHYQSRPGYDTAFREPLMFDPDTAAAILTRMTDTTKNLSVQLNTSFVKIVKDDDRWEVSLIHDDNKQTVRARVIIDATPDGAIMKAAGGSYKIESNWRLNYDNTLYRTSVAMGRWRPAADDKDSLTNKVDFHVDDYFIPINAYPAKGVDNLLVTGLQWPEHDESIASVYLLPDMNLGQGAGVIAAYCAFFKTTTKNLNVRTIQGELLDFKGGLLPVNDIIFDPFWRAIQQVCATGLLKPVIKPGVDVTTVSFNPDSIVTTAEIKPAMLELYSRAFIWFNKTKPGAQFTIGNLLSFISELTLTDPDNLQNAIGKAWTERFHFTSSFDLNRPITRREFAILANKYLNPFGRTVDLDGKVVN